MRITSIQVILKEWYQDVCEDKFDIIKETWSYRIIVFVPSIQIPSRSFGWIVTEVRESGSRVSVVAACVFRWVITLIRQFVLDGCCTSRTHRSYTSGSPVVERIPKVDGGRHETTLEHLSPHWRALREWSGLPPMRMRRHHSHRNSPSV